MLLEQGTKYAHFVRTNDAAFIAMVVHVNTTERDVTLLYFFITRSEVNSASTRLLSVQYHRLRKSQFITKKVKKVCTYLDGFEYATFLKIRFLLHSL